jgi:hypothetical protein
MDNITKLLVEMYKKRDPNAYLAAPVHISDLALIVEKQDAELGLLHLELAEAIKVIEKVYAGAPWAAGDYLAKHTLGVQNDN